MKGFHKSKWSACLCFITKSVLSHILHSILGFVNWWIKAKGYLRVSGLKNRQEHLFCSILHRNTESYFIDTLNINHTFILFSTWLTVRLNTIIILQSSLPTLGFSASSVTVTDAIFSHHYSQLMKTSLLEWHFKISEVLVKSWLFSSFDLLTFLHCPTSNATTSAIYEVPNKIIGDLN